MWKFIHRMGSPKYFYDFTGPFIPWLWGIFAALTVWGVYLGLFVAPPDYQQGDSYRIMFVHVPAAWMSLFIYVLMAFWGAISLIWRVKITDVLVISAAPIGAAFTFLALATGSLWGKPMWGAWWVWDARLTSELVLLFLYLGVIALYGAIEDKRNAGRAVAFLSIVGVINVPIIHYSVQWWNTLHQGSSVTITGGSSMPASMLWPLLIMATAFKFYFGAVLFMKARTDILERERNSGWVKQRAEEKSL